MAKKAKELTQGEKLQADRENRLGLWRQGRLQASNASMVYRKVDGKTLKPNLDGIGRRTDMERYPWMPMSARMLTDAQAKDAKIVLDPDVMKSKTAAKADYVGSYYGHRGVLRPEYDLLEPFTMVDTEAYLKQAINRRMSLIMRNGYEIISDQRQDYADYIQKRLETIEYVTRRPIMNLFRDILTNLSLCSNCFLYKIRDEEGSGVPQKAGAKVPVAGYSIIPAHQIFPYLEKGVITKWRRYYETGMPFEDYALEDIIHLHFDRKPGHIYGTPRTIAVREDVWALRRLEENVELLFINHLFPLFHVKVGTPEAPCTYFEDGSSEIDMIRLQIETMPKEGIFVTDERAQVDVVGAQNQSLNSEKIIAHLKGRVYTGLGMSPLDMGEGDTANRSTADNISQVLKDSIKADLDNFAGQMRMTVFAELFSEANKSISVQTAVANTHIRFHEIDTDNRIKEENHAMQLYNNHNITHAESRKMMKRKPMTKEQQKDTHYEREVKDLVTHEFDLNKELSTSQTEDQKSLIAAQTKQMAAEGELHKTKATAQTKVLHARTKHVIAAGEAAAKKATPNKKRAQNRNTPTNQHGSKSSPSKAKSSLEAAAGFIYDRLMIAHELCDFGPDADPNEWRQLSHSAIEGSVQELLSEVEDGAENSYTRQIQKGSSRLKDMVAMETDPEKIYVLVSAEINEDADNERPEDITTDNDDSHGDQDSASGHSDSGSLDGISPESEELDSESDHEIQ